MKLQITLPSGENAVSDSSQLTLKTDPGNPNTAILCLGPYILAIYEGAHLSASPLSPKPESEIANVTKVSL
jgi:hypothetical protein